MALSERLKQRFLQQHKHHFTHNVITSNINCTPLVYRSTWTDTSWWNHLHNNKTELSVSFSHNLCWITQSHTTACSSSTRLVCSIPCRVKGWCMLPCYQGCRGRQPVSTGTCSSCINTRCGICTCSKCSSSTSRSTSSRRISCSITSNSRSSCSSTSSSSSICSSTRSNGSCGSSTSSSSSSCSSTSSSSSGCSGISSSSCSGTSSDSSSCSISSCRSTSSNSISRCCLESPSGEHQVLPPQLSYICLHSRGYGNDYSLLSSSNTIVGQYTATTKLDSEHVCPPLGIWLRESPSQKSNSDKLGLLPALCISILKGTFPRFPSKNVSSGDRRTGSAAISSAVSRVVEEFLYFRDEQFMKTDISGEHEQLFDGNDRETSVTKSSSCSFIHFAFCAFKRHRSCISSVTTHNQPSLYSPSNYFHQISDVKRCSFAVEPRFSESSVTSSPCTSLMILDARRSLSQFLYFCHAYSVGISQLSHIWTFIVLPCLKTHCLPADCMENTLLLYLNKNQTYETTKRQPLSSCHYKATDTDLRLPSNAYLLSLVTKSVAHCFTKTYNISQSLSVAEESRPFKHSHLPGLCGCSACSLTTTLKQTKNSVITSKGKDLPQIKSWQTCAVEPDQIAIGLGIDDKSLVAVVNACAKLQYVNSIFLRLVVQFFSHRFCGNLLKNIYGVKSSTSASDESLCDWHLRTVSCSHQSHANFDLLTGPSSVDFVLTVRLATVLLISLIKLLRTVPRPLCIALGIILYFLAFALVLLPSFAESWSQ
eukprot:GHVQ01010527.1.p1 GENE.GHVQ01010527.1~~GHVQ01010527.1.p1  ORF type:complete len:764 (-),score=94.59 GHVQ01010527.1:31-2322(-)